LRVEAAFDDAAFDFDRADTTLLGFGAGVLLFDRDFTAAADFAPWCDAAFFFADELEPTVLA
jgi:hypothetical protein